jgi:hypothetical protein
VCLLIPGTKPVGEQAGCGQGKEQEQSRGMFPRYDRGRRTGGVLVVREDWLRVGGDAAFVAPQDPPGGGPPGQGVSPGEAATCQWTWTGI